MLPKPKAPLPKPKAPLLKGLMLDDQGYGTDKPSVYFGPSRGSSSAAEAGNAAPSDGTNIANLPMLLAGGLVAICLGAMISGNVAVCLHLSPTDGSPFHAIYISAVVTAIGTVALAVGALSFVFVPLPSTNPPWWSLLGGLAITFSFISIPAGAVLGVQSAMVAMLAGNLGTALALDCMFGTTRASPWLIVGLLTVVGGVILDIWPCNGVDPHGARSSFNKPFTMMSVVYLLLSVGCGAGFALQSFLNTELSRHLGSPLRSACLAGFVQQLGMLPIWVGLWATGASTPQISFDADNWYLWLYSSLQMATYMLGITALPRLCNLDFMPMFLCVQIGQVGDCFGSLRIASECYGCL